MRYVIAILSIVFLVGCTDSQHAKETLNDRGFKDVEITGYSWFACSDDDTYKTGFEAKSPNGRTVEGTVCSGIFLKGSTIRTH